MIRPKTRQIYGFPGYLQVRKRVKRGVISCFGTGSPEGLGTTTENKVETDDRIIRQIHRRLSPNCVFGGCIRKCLPR